MSGAFIFKMDDPEARETFSAAMDRLSAPRNASEAAWRERRRWVAQNPEKAAQRHASVLATACGEGFLAFLNERYPNRRKF